MKDRWRKGAPSWGWGAEFGLHFKSLDSGASLLGRGWFGIHFSSELNRRPGNGDGLVGWVVAQGCEVRATELCGWAQDRVQTDASSRFWTSEAAQPVTGWECGAQPWLWLILSLCAPGSTSFFLHLCVPPLPVLLPTLSPGFSFSSLQLFNSTSQCWHRQW